MKELVVDTNFQWWTIPRKFCEYFNSTTKAVCILKQRERRRRGGAGKRMADDGKEEEQDKEKRYKGERWNETEFLASRLCPQLEVF